MAVRSSMAAIISRVRQLVGDVTSPQDFTDQDVQDVCDAYRADIRYELLAPAPDIQPGQNGATAANFVWATYFSDFQHWEDDVVLQGLNVSTGQAWVLLTPTASEPIVGRWTFAVTLPSIATPPAQYPPVWATGKVYDLYCVAAMLLRRRIGLRSLTMFDFASDGQSFKVGTVLDRWERLAASYLAMSWNRSVDLVRTDLAADQGARPGLLPNVLAPGVSGPEGY